ncbi:MAG TPA: response regulator [Methanospirillum sp.]|uniref:ATP-binding response regulator n=1 Tax=Methanospirillum sp. TaxID=45200 RepID=UPI002CC933D9|nr:response regulator [Methanospirillum sp.]HOJ96248.1 response regulator [Methanospirillum sp.]HPP77259.1 response regulator [Methanospirillum sp.]
MAPYRVLIVEDNRIEALDLIKIIEAHGYDLAGVAKTGEEAIRISREKHPDAIIMDIRLAGDMDGISAAEEINRNDHIPIIFLTAYSDIKTIRRATSTRLSGFITKPFSENDIVHALEVALYKHESEKLVHENRQWLHTVLESVGEGIIVVHTSGEIRLMNKAAYTILGIQGDSIGQNLSDILVLYRSSDNLKVRIPFQIQNKTPLSEIDYPLYLIQPSGFRIYIDGMISPLLEQDCGCTGVVINLRDISETIVMKRVVHDAYRQIEENLEKFALLNDQIRNPLSIIVAILDINECEHLKDIMPYIHEIDRIIDQLDNGYIASSKIRNFLKKHHEID